ncbi:MAG: hypothetical protein HY349_05160 [Nitrospirae bacterium]|nr:hypothetical protein [Nitrospirota bacterium]
MTLSLLISACGAVKMYPGPALARDKIAVLEIRNVTLYALDDEAVKLGNQRKLQILPGEHVLRASHAMAGYDAMPITYTFTAEAGRTYFFGADYEIQRTLSWRPWVRDAKSGQTIGRWKP